MFSNNTSKDNEPRTDIDKGIADSKQDEQSLRGIQPRHQFMFRLFKLFRLWGIFALVIAVLLFVVTLLPNWVNMPEVILKIITQSWFRIGILVIGGVGVLLLALMVLIRLLFLRKAPFDDWVFEIAEKRIGTSIIFYDRKYIYLNYDRGGKEVDKRDFVSEMSDKSVHYSYFYINTDIDQGYIKVECKKREPIPNRASFSPEDDKFWNIVPMGLTINPDNQSISPIGWYLNDQNINEELYQTIPSTSILICGGTGCHETDEVIPMYDTLEK